MLKAQGRGRGSARVRIAIVVVAALIVAVLALVPGPQPVAARPGAEQTDPVTAPLVCDGTGGIGLNWGTGSGSSGSRGGRRYANAWVPAGATVSFHSTGEIRSVNWWASNYFAQTNLILGREELNGTWNQIGQGGVGLSGYNWGPPEAWYPGGTWNTSWTNNGASRAIRFSLEMGAGLTSGGMWTTDITVSGGGDFDGSDCDKLREALGVQSARGAMDDPVNTATGNFYDRSVDLAAPAGIYGLSFERTYNSMDHNRWEDADTGQSGVLGDGWSTSLDVALVDGHDDSLILRRADGQRLVFPEASPGTWTVPSRLFASLNVAADPDPDVERRVLAFSDAQVWTFDGNGRLLSMEDGFGQELTITRDGTTGVPETLSAATPGGAAFDIDVVDTGDDGLIDQLVAADTATVEFTYDGSDRLETVTGAHLSGDPGSGETFVYDAEGRIERIDTVVDPLGSPVARVENTYYAQGQVHTQTLPGGDVATFDYCAPAETGCGITDPTNRVTRVVHSGPGLPDETTYHVHDSDLRLVEVIDPYSETQTMTWTGEDRLDSFQSRRGASSDPTIGSTSGFLESVALPDPGTGAVSGDIVDIEYCSATDPRMTSITDASGAITTYAYGSSGSGGYPCVPGVATPSSVTTADGDAEEATTQFTTADGLVTSSTDADGVVTNYVWNAAKRQLLRSSVDHNGTASGGVLVTHYGYDAAGRLKVIRTPTGVETWWVYDGAGRLVREVGPVGITRTCNPGCTFNSPPSSDTPIVLTTYWSDGSLRSRTDAAGYTTDFEREYLGGGGWSDTTTYPSDNDSTARDVRIDVYDAGGNLRQERFGDPTDLAITVHAYDALGRRVTTTTPEGVDAHFRYDEDGNLTHEVLGPDATDSDLSDTTETSYDFRGRVTSVAGPDIDTTTAGRQTHSSVSYEYDAADRIIEQVEGAGSDARRTWFRYDSAGRLRYTIVDLDGDDVTPDLGGSPSIDPEDQVTEQTYTAAGRLDTTLTAPPNVDTFDWLDPANDDDKLETVNDYDDAGRLVEVTAPGNRITSYVLDGDGRTLTETGPGGYITSYTYGATYNGAERRTDTVSTPSPTGSGTSLSTIQYNMRGELEFVTEPHDPGITNYPGVRYEYTPDGLLKFVWDERVINLSPAWNHSAVSYRYDGRGNRTGRQYSYQTEPGGSSNSRLQRWWYNLDDQVTGHSTSVVPPDMYSYDDRGRLETVSHESGREDVNVYWNSGLLRETTSTQPSASTVVVERSYDSQGRQVGLSDPTGTSTYDFDVVGNLVGQVTPNLDDPGTPRTLDITHDQLGNRRGLTYPDGAEFRYTHDSRGLLTEAEAYIDGLGWFPAAEYLYDDDGDRTETIVAGTYGNRQWTYHGNGAHEPTSYTQDMDPDGTDAEGDNGGGGTDADITSDLEWNHSGRLVEETSVWGTATLEYDAAGQLLEVDSPVDFTYTYGPRGERLTETIGGVTTNYAYNSRMELTATDAPGTADDATYTYDDDGRRTGVSIGGGAETYAFDYDARGLLEETVHDDGVDTLTIGRSYDGDGRLTQLDLGGGIVNELVWDPSGDVPQVIDAYVGSSILTRLAYGNERISFEFSAGGTPVASGFYPYDAHGSTIPDGNNIVTSVAYTPFGEPATDPGQDIWIGYRSEFHIDDLIHLRNRDYDPSTGTFLTPDPLDSVDGEPTVGNPYHYADNDPLNKVDPLGLRPVDACTVGGHTQNAANYYAGVGESIIPSSLGLDNPVLELAGVSMPSIDNPVGFDDIVSTINWTDASSLYCTSSTFFTVGVVAGTAAQIAIGYGLSRTAGPRPGGGSGPVPGVLEASPRVRSVAAINNWRGSPVEFVFDPATRTFVMGRPAPSAGLTGSPHQQLARAINADPNTVVGGVVSRGPNGGKLLWNENSGHYYQNWNDWVRAQFPATLRRYGVNI
jgi:RHS repeat-associated protein